MRWLLLATVALDLVAIWSSWLDLTLIERLEVGDLVTESDVADSERRQSAVSDAQLALGVITGAFFIAWVYRAYGNLQRLGAGGLRFHRGWAIASWFVPVLAFVRPKQIVNDIWRASNPDLPPRAGIDWVSARVPALFALWWGLFLASWALWAAVGTGAFGWGETLEEYKNIDRGWMAADLVDALAALVAARVVHKTTRRQEQRAERVAAQG